MNVRGMLQPFRAVVSQRDLLVVCVTTAIAMMAQSILSPVLPQFIESLGVNLTLIGLVIGVFGFGRLLMNLPTGIIADRIGRRPVFIAGPVIMTVSTVLMVFAESYWQLVALRFVQGLGSGMYMTAAMIYLTDIAGPDQRARYLSYQQGSLLVGASIGPAIGGFVAELWGLHAPFYFMAVLAAVAAVWAVTQVKEPKRQPRAPQPVSASGKLPRVGTLQLLSDPSFVVVGLFGMAIFVNRSGGRQSILPLFADDKGMGPGAIGLLFSFGVFAQLVTVVLAGGLSDKFGRKATIVPSAIIASAGALAFIFGSHYAVLFAAMGVMMVGEGISGPAPVAFAADIAQQKGLGGVGVGLYRTFGDFGFVLGPIMTGFIADRGGLGWGLFSGEIMLVILAVLLWVVAKEPAKEKTATPAASRT